MLFQVLMNKVRVSRRLIFELTSVPQSKAIMGDNAMFIHFPPVGGSASLIMVYEDKKISIQRTIRSIMHLVRISCYCLHIDPHFV
jgi:hypothetical protein